jgi:hypothetical protein
MEGFCEMFNDFELRVKVSLQCINGDYNEPTAATLRCRPITQCTREIRLKEFPEGRTVSSKLRRLPKESVTLCLIKLGNSFGENT